MPTTKPRVNLVLNDELEERIKDCWHRLKIDNKTEALRLIIERGLDALENENPSQKSKK